MPLIDINRNQNPITPAPQTPVNVAPEIQFTTTDPLSGKMVDGKVDNAVMNITNDGIKEIKAPSNVSQVVAQPVQNINNQVDAKLNQIDPATGLQNKNYTLLDILQEAVKLKASDIHIAVGYRASVRVDGQLKTINSEVISNEKAREYITELLKGKTIDIDKIDQKDLSFSAISRRFRVNIFKQKGNFSIALRIIPESIASLDLLGLPAIVREFSKIASGLVLVTGPTGSGKSTTIASILNDINLNSSKHVITLEDPIEYIFPNALSLIEQREFETDFSEWEDALRAILRQDPDVVLLGEMRDKETISSGITISETGHLAFATLHTNSASQTVDRIVDVFPETQQNQIRTQLANVIAAVISQRLIPLPNGGRKPAIEIMIATPAVKNAIREGKTYQIDNIISTSSDVGMVSLESSLVAMVKSGLISADTAKRFSNKPDQIDILLKDNKFVS